MPRRKSKRQSRALIPAPQAKKAQPRPSPPARTPQSPTNTVARGYLVSSPNPEAQRAYKRKIANEAVDEFMWGLEKGWSIGKTLLSLLSDFLPGKALRQPSPSGSRALVPSRRGPTIEEAE